MPHLDPFRGHRFSKDVNLLAVRWYCRYPPSYRDVRDLLAEGIAVDAATVCRWVRKFGCEIRQRANSIVGDVQYFPALSTRTGGRT